VTSVVLATACRDSAPREPIAEPDPVTERAARWSATSPPPARACRGDEDCGVFAVAPGDDPCCDITVTAAPLSVHYMKANADWRKASCAGVACPARELPGAQPASCAFVPRCDRGTCSNACETAPPAAATPQ
jgi:hypothetical protein